MVLLVVLLVLLILLLLLLLKLLWQIAHSHALLKSRHESGVLTLPSLFCQGSVG